MKFLKELLLRPFSLLYGAITSLRNILYDHGLIKSYEFPFPVICVGNITVGGTGKTPHVEYIARLLSGSLPVAVLSRGYKRKSKGFRFVNPADDASVTGDEPLQIATQLQGVKVAVDSDRVNGIKKIMESAAGKGAIILDDGFQHRSVRAGLNIILTDYGRLMTRDHLMPYGYLRENIKGVSRANVIIVTKTPAAISSEEREKLREEISPLSEQNLFFTTLEYGELRPLFPDSVSHDNPTPSLTSDTGVVLVTGIANPAPLISYLSGIVDGVRPVSFPDHHYFSDLDINKITEAFGSMHGKEKMIITTEKDAVRLKDFTNIASPLRNNFFILPVRIKFIENEEKFIKIITDYAG
jgi:tetraacyldisaccharide 4'-kinase